MKSFMVLSLLFYSVLAIANADVSGIMMVVKGDIQVTSAKDKKTSAAKVGTKISSGDTVTAGPDSRAKIVMSDKNVLNISPDSKIVIAKYENDGKDNKNVELNVLYGKVRANVEQKYDGDKNKFNIKTPSAVAGVRGTDFITGYNPGNKQTQVITFSGAVAVGTPGLGGKIENPVFVKPGEMTSVSAGQAPEPPKSVPQQQLNEMRSETGADASAAKQDNMSATGELNSGKKDKDSSVAQEQTPPADTAAPANAPPSPTAPRDVAASPTMISNSDLGPELSKDINFNSNINLVAPTYNPAINNLVTNPYNNQFITDAVRGGTTKATIIIQGP